MRGSSTYDSFMKTRLTYKRAKCEGTGRESQYFTLISVVTCHCVCVCVCFVTPTSRTSALCIIMVPVPTGEPAVDCLWMLLQLPLTLPFLSFPRFLFTPSGIFGRKAPSSPPGLLDVSPDEPHTHRRRSAFRCDGRDVALVGRGGRSHKTRVHHICRCTRQSQRTLSILAF